MTPADTQQDARTQGVLLARSFHWQAALPLLRQAVSQANADFDVCYQFGLTLRATRQFQEAADAFKQAESYAAGNSDALFYHAICLNEAGRPADAIAAYRQLLAQHPNFAQGWSLLGALLKTAQRLDEAIAAFRVTLAIQEDIPTRNALVIALYSSDQIDAAIAEGLQNLVAKDAQAMQNFAASPFHNVGLTLSSRSFDPKLPHRNAVQAACPRGASAMFPAVNWIRMAGRLPGRGSRSGSAMRAGAIIIHRIRGPLRIRVSRVSGIK
jgi:tetratricopeptide (TPR) repeat protein